MIDCFTEKFLFPIVHLSVSYAKLIFTSFITLGSIKYNNTTLTTLVIDNHSTNSNNDNKNAGVFQGEALLWLLFFTL